MLKFIRKGLYRQNEGKISQGKRAFDTSKQN